MNTEMKHVQGPKLNALVKNSKTADALVHYFALRQRTRPFTDIKRLNMDLSRGKFEINEEDSMDFFKNLEKQGLGRFIHARKKDGHPVFAWGYNMKKIAQAAVDGKDTYVEPIAKEKARIQDGPRLKRKMNIGYPVKAAIGVKQAVETLQTKEVVQPNAKAEVVEYKLTPPVQLQIDGQQLVAISQEEYNQLLKVKDFLTSLR